MALGRSLVTGGSGFLGRRLVSALLAQGGEVIVFDLRPYQHDDPATAAAVVPRTGTITQLGDVVAACRDVDVVYHCVSADPLDNRNEALMWSVNVEGTKNVIEACKQSRVGKLVYVSSASVVFDGSHLINADETIPYPSKFPDFYSKTKAEAEKLVLAASKGALATCAIRPSAIFGEGDPIFVPRLAEAGRTGKTKYMLGSGKTKWEFTYVGNVADACIIAADKLAPDSHVAGQAYFITNDETTLFWEQCGVILKVYKPAKPPSLSRQRVLLVNTHRQISCAKAKRDLGYEPKVSMEEGMNRTIQSFQHLASSKTTKSE